MEHIKSNHYVFVIFIILAVTILIAGVYFRPFVHFSITHELTGPENPEVWSLLEKGAPLEDIQHAVRSTDKPIEHIVWVGGSILECSIEENRSDVVLWLLNEGANPDGVYSRGGPLRVAIHNKDEDMVRLLLEHGADPNAGKGDVMVSAIGEEDLGIIRLLLEHGADPDLDFGAGGTPRKLALDSENMELRRLFQNSSNRQSIQQPPLPAK
jgi:hypothetical protein